jgi:hypothetical protein
VTGAGVGVVGVVIGTVAFLHFFAALADPWCFLHFLLATAMGPPTRWSCPNAAPPTSTAPRAAASTPTATSR